MHIAHKRMTPADHARQLDRQAIEDWKMLQAGEVNRLRILLEHCQEIAGQQAGQIEHLRQVLAEREAEIGRLNCRLCEEYQKWLKLWRHDD